MIDSYRVRCKGHSTVCEQGFDLRSKQQTITANPIKQGFLAYTVAREQQDSCPPVPNCKRKHAAQPFEAATAIGFVGVDNDFRITLRTKPVPTCFEVSAELTEVVDFPIKRDPHGASGVTHRLSSYGAQVDDRESTVRQAYIAVGPYTLPIGATMRQRVRHLQHFLLGDQMFGVEIDFPADATHTCTVSFCLLRLHCA